MEIDYLVNAAGVLFVRSIWEVGLEEWRKLYAVNVEGTFFLIQTLGRQMAGLVDDAHAAPPQFLLDLIALDDRQAGAAQVAGGMRHRRLVARLPQHQCGRRKDVVFARAANWTDQWRRERAGACGSR